MMSPSVLASDLSQPTRPKPVILDTLPNPPVLEECTPRIQQKLDLILLALEALELEGSEYMLKTARELEIDRLIDNRVVLWRLRCSNPWRRSYNRNILKIDEAKALMVIAGYRARQLTVTIRQLILACEQIQDKGLPVDQHFRLSEYLERFRAHFRSRMNPRRAKVAAYLADETMLNQLALSLLGQLLFCTGISGVQRLWISLFDGEV